MNLAGTDPGNAIPLDHNGRIADYLPFSIYKHPKTNNRRLRSGHSGHSDENDRQQRQEGGPIHTGHHTDIAAYPAMQALPGDDQ